jgi:hypothetical protein
MRRLQILALLGAVTSAARAVRVSGLTFDTYYLHHEGQPLHVISILTTDPSSSIHAADTPSTSTSTSQQSTSTSTSTHSDAGATLSGRAPQASATLYPSTLPPADPSILVVPINATIATSGPGGYNGNAELTIGCACGQPAISRPEAEAAVAKLGAALGASYFVPAGSAVLAVSGRVVAYACNWNAVAFGTARDFFAFAAHDVQAQCGSHVGGAFRVGGLDAGYAAWEEGVDFCVEAEKLKSEKCP